MKIRILIADDHAVVREGLKKIINDNSDMDVVAEVSDGQAAIDRIRKSELDVVVLDLTLPELSGIEILKMVRRDEIELPILVLSMHPEDQYAVRVLRAGASGYLTKESAPEQLVDAIRKIYQGGKYITPTVAERLALDLTAGHERPTHEILSDREFEVLRRLASGKSLKEIAENLRLSVKTVSTYRARILQKMNMKSNADIIHYAIDRKLIA